MRSGSSAQGGVYTEKQLAGERLEGGRPVLTHGSQLPLPAGASRGRSPASRGITADLCALPCHPTPPRPAPGSFSASPLETGRPSPGSRGPAPGHHAPLPRALHDTPTYPRGPGSPVSAGITLENSIVQQPKFINKRNPGLHWCFLKKDGTVQSPGTGQLHPAPLPPAPSPTPADAQAPRAA